MVIPTGCILPCFGLPARNQVSDFALGFCENPQTGPRRGWNSTPQEPIGTQSKCAQVDADSVCFHILSDLIWLLTAKIPTIFFFFKGNLSLFAKVSFGPVSFPKHWTPPAGKLGLGVGLESLLSGQNSFLCTDGIWRQDCPRSKAHGLG